MASEIQVAGLVTVKVGTGTSFALETLGTSFDKPRTSDQGYSVPVHGDLHGGPDGPPIDVQNLGRVIRVQLELSKWDSAIADKLIGRTFGQQTPGTVTDAQIGDLMFQDSQSYRVLLSSAGDPYNFLQCVIPNDPVVKDPGTKWTRLVLSFEAHRVQSTGVIYNTTTS